MHYYEIALLGLNAPLLTYSSKEELAFGAIVEVPLKSKLKKGVVVKKVSKPEFETIAIANNSSSEYYSSFQLELAQFIASYYFSSLGEALALLYPFKKSVLVSSPSIETSKLPKLTQEQKRAYSEIEQKDIALLFGVTGSGKTEIYIHLIAKALQEEKSTILLMPEIALTPQITQRITNYFGEAVSTWHSKLSKQKREEILENIYSGKVKVVIGARSALFLPMQNLGLIIVDEAHDDSYKAMSRPRYNAKDLSIYMAKKLAIKALLGSATPLVSDYYKFDVVRLKKPFYEAKKEYIFLAGEEIDYKILQAIHNVVEQKEQALIFVPTRANFKYLVCNSCGKTHLCPFCSIGMSIHSKKRVLQCHYCNYASKIPNRCEYCGSEDLISNRVGTAEVVEMIKSEIKDAKVLQFDKDNITTANKLYKAIEKIQKKEVNVIVGTQMLSKGHDYSEITLIVITGLDFIIAVGDYRAKERAIALFHQIAGRGGRAKDAKIIIKTSQKEFYERYINDYEIFLKEELEFRKELYPPFKNLARVLIASRDYKKAQNILEEALLKLKAFPQIEIVGSGLAPIEKISNKWRFFILLRAEKKVELLKALYAIKSLELEIDIDPVDFS